MARLPKQAQSVMWGQQQQYQQQQGVTSQRMQTQQQSLQQPLLLLIPQRQLRYQHRLVLSSVLWCRCTWRWSGTL
jgi:hypothetical protein